MLEERIARESSVSVADYMEACTRHYYAARDPFGANGDFITAPEISQIFGELIGAWLASEWLESGAPGECALLELGPGRGTLMRDIFRATRGVPGFHESARLLLLESSPALRALQKQALPRAEWIKDLSTLPKLPLFAVANEFFDALPIRQHVGDRERKISLKDGKFHFTLPARGVRETCEPARALTRQMAAHIAHHGGAALIVDYGYGEGHGDTLQAVFRHEFADPLENPGEADVTAHVDFAALSRAAREAGAFTHLATQGDFLRRLGAELRASFLCRGKPREQQEAILSGLERLVSPAQMGELFKALAVTATGRVPEGFA